MDNGKKGFIYKNVFYELGSVELNNLLLIEGKKKENEGTLLGMLSEVENILITEENSN